MSYLQQLNLLLWKNFVIQKRSLLGLILKLTIPALFAIVFIPIRASIKSKFHENETTFDSFLVDSLSNDLPLFKNSTFAYCPNTSVLIDRVMRQVSSLLVLETASFKTEEEMISYMAKDYEYKMFRVSILNDSSTNFTYKLRFPHKPRNEDKKNTDWTEWKTGLLSPIFPMLGPRSKDDDTGGDPGYFIEGFLAAQKAIDFSLISDTNPEVMKLNIELKRFSYPPYSEDNFILLIIGMFPFIILMSFIFIVILTAKEIVHEKEKGIKEAMKLMGMSSWVYWLSWYIKMQTLLIPSIIITVISFTVQLPSATGTGTAAIINKTSPVVIAIFLFLYSSSLTTFTLMCSTLFKKSNSAAAGTAIIYFLTYMPNNVISLQFQNINPIVKILLCLVNNLAMSIGIELIGIFEGFGTGIHFFNLSKGVNEDDYFSLGHVFLLLFLDNFLHMFLIFYFDNLFPGEHGIAKPWNFIFLRFVNKKEKKIQSDSSNTDTNINMNYFEDDSIYSSRKIGIKIYQIYKFYQHLNEKKIAIENLNLNIYEGHITVLLGHNGAGKRLLIIQHHYN